MIDDDTNTRMKNGVDAACAVSVSRTKSPMAANTQNIAKPHTNAITYASTIPPKLPWNRKPTSERRRRVTIASSAAWRSRSAMARPPTTAERAIGSARNRSMSPDFESSAKKMLTPNPSKMAICAR